MVSFFLSFNHMVLNLITAGLKIAVVYSALAALALSVIAAAVSFLLTTLTSAPFIPTKQKTLLKMFEFADIKPGDVVYDLGCGDGRLVFEAERRGARAAGVELNWGVYLLALFHKKKLRSPGRIIRGDLFQVDLRDADVVFFYLMPKAMKKLDHKFKQELRPGCRVVSHDFELPGWKKDKEYIKEGKASSVHLYIV